MWTLQSPRLESAYHVFAPDLPGFGKEPARTGWEPESGGDPRLPIVSYSDWIAEEISSRCAGKVFLVGYSMGGTLALDVALRYPSLVGRLGLIATCARWGAVRRGRR